MKFTVEGNVISKISLTVDAPDGDVAQQLFRSITGGSVTGIQPAFSSIDIVQSKAGDWRAVYLDGKIVDQGSELSEAQILKILQNVTHIRVSTRETDHYGYFPENLSDVGTAHDAQG